MGAPYFLELWEPQNWKNGSRPSLSSCSMILPANRLSDKTILQESVSMSNENIFLSVDECSHHMLNFPLADVCLLYTSDAADE